MQHRLAIRPRHQFAKTVAELGLIGLAALLAVFVATLVLAWRSRQATANLRWGSAGAAFAAYYIVMPLHALKGWPLDWEPANIYFWMFAAMAVMLPRLSERLRQAPRATLQQLWLSARAARRGQAAPRPVSAPARLKPSL